VTGRVFEKFMRTSRQFRPPFFVVISYTRSRVNSKRIKCAGPRSTNGSSIRRNLNVVPENREGNVEFSNTRKLHCYMCRCILNKRNPQLPASWRIFYRRTRDNARRRGQYAYTTIARYARTERNSITRKTKIERDYYYVRSTITTRRRQYLRRYQIKNEKPNTVIARALITRELARRPIRGRACVSDAVSPT